MFGGIVIGVIYDVTHVTGVPKRGKIFTAAADILFAVLSAAVFVFVTYLAGFCDVRLYSVAGFAAGFAAERLTLKILVAKGVLAVYNYIIKIKAKLHLRRQERKAKPRPKKRKNDRIAV